MNQYRRRRLDILGVPDAFCLQLLLTGPVGIVHHERGEEGAVAVGNRKVDRF
ncbi:hypothetical protein [Paenibacillus rhizosphaerae]|uniref:hypothetical protein n=1 Tax=Paenibacillus rhizosphaerae TaxID=297318 RepID=UPI003263DCAF